MFLGSPSKNVGKCGSRYVWHWHSLMEPKSGRWRHCGLKKCSQRYTKILVTDLSRVRKNTFGQLPWRFCRISTRVFFYGRIRSLPWATYRLHGKQRILFLDVIDKLVREDDKMQETIAVLQNINLIFRKNSDRTF